MATSLNQPQAISQPFAQNGDKNVIPVTNDGTTGAASESLGFPQITSVPVAQGGIPPARKDFNGIFNVLSNQYFYLQNGGSFTFNQDVSDAIGGYPVDAILQYTDTVNNMSYQVRSLIPNNTYNFVTTPSYIDGVHWAKAFSEDLSDYVHKTGSNTISANNTFSGTNTFSGSTSLSTNTTGVTQATNDASTKIATTQFVQNVAVTKANKDMDNLTSTGQNIANWSTNVTNCITEIPQDIKLELNNGTLTLKAGSKVYYPNGFTGTTPKFDVITIAEDKTLSGSITTTGTTMVCCYVSTEMFCYRYGGDAISQGYFSGTTAPTGHTYMVWYDTANNIIKTTANGGSTWDTYRSLPIAIVSYSSSSGSYTSIDQVFNGFGYIGSTVFALPGVKGLIPNGRNEDWTLKSTEFTTFRVLTASLTGTSTNVGIWIGAVNLNLSTTWNYYEDVNLNIQSSGGVVIRCLAGTLDISSNIISNFTPKTTFHALDYNDFKQADDNNVKLTGDQSINGVKTFNNTSFTKNLYARGNITLGTSTNTWGHQLQFQDTAGKRIARIQPLAVDTSENIIGMWVNNADNTVEQGILLRSDGVTSAPTPATSDNSTKIATTAYCNNKHQLVSALPASPNADVFYYIPEN